MSSIAQRIKAARIEAGMTIAEAAKRAGRSASWWKTYESGARNPGKATLFSIAIALGKDPRAWPGGSTALTIP